MQMIHRASVVALISMLASCVTCVATVKAAESW
jgi:hypothetical protein